MFEKYSGPAEYESLAMTLKAAFDQAASGKGKERHACDDNFEDQLMCYLAKQVGIAGPVFQVCKKAIEACRLPPEMAIAELKGAINYAAGAIIDIERGMAAKKQELWDEFPVNGSVGSSPFSGIDKTKLGIDSDAVATALVNIAKANSGGANDCFNAEHH